MIALKWRYGASIRSSTLQRLNNVNGGDQIPCRIYNLGNRQSENLMDYIAQIEKTLGRKANINFLPMQEWDVKETSADIADAERDFGFKPKTSIYEGIPKFIEWYKDFYNV